eukprot:1211447-Amphidinium_carterae.1
MSRLVSRMALGLCMQSTMACECQKEIAAGAARLWHSVPTLTWTSWNWWHAARRARSLLLSSTLGRLRLQTRAPRCSYRNPCMTIRVSTLQFSAVTCSWRLMSLSQSTSASHNPLDLPVVDIADPEGRMLKGVVVVNPEKPFHELTVVRHGCMVLKKHLLEPDAQLRPRQGEDLSKWLLSQRPVEAAIRKAPTQTDIDSKVSEAIAKEKEEAEKEAKLAEQSSMPPLLQTPVQGENLLDEAEESSPQLMSTVGE